MTIIMRWSTVALAFLALAVAEDTTTSQTTEQTTQGSTVVTLTTPVALPSGTYQDVSTTIMLGESETAVTSTGTHNGTITTSSNGTLFTTTTNSLTLLVGGHGTTTIGNNSMNATGTTSATATSSPVVNTQPCNNYVEFCTRKYSNITMVAAHNSPFVRKNNVAANQALDVTQQLEDGIRMLQFQAHNVNGTMYLCHSSCEMLNVGTLEDYLTTVNKWMRKNPFEVVSFIIGNFDYVSPGNFTGPIYNAGFKDMIYSPPKAPMALNDWPTLSEMIVRGKRAVFFMDYQADPKVHPWLMDEFSQMWETPFSPTNADFPCTQQRPPGLSEKDAKNRMYMANHNLNLQLNLGDLSLLIPNSATLNVTNSNMTTSNGTLGTMAQNCKEKWGRAPNFLLVDYYNYGNFNGSVFQVAADMNNVTYDGKCCGKESAASLSASVAGMSTVVLVAMGAQMLMSAF